MIFISYSRQNEALVVPLVKLLRASGSEVFVDVYDLEYGGDWKQQLEFAIKKSTTFLLFWSDSAKKSVNVENEWKLALTVPMCRIVPIMLDESPLPLELSHIHGSDGLEQVFKTLNKAKIHRKWLLMSCFAIAGLLAVFVPLLIVMGPIEYFAHWVMNFVSWSILLGFLMLPVLGVYSISKRLSYRKIVNNLGLSQ